MKKRFLISVLGLTVALSLSMASMAFAANTSGAGSTAPVVYPIDYPNADQVPGNNLQTTISTLDTQHDNGLVNANKTGVGVGTNDGSTATTAVKIKPNERAHGEYQNNTDSCASCHQTHTGAAAKLLFKDSVYDTCIACHDGTLGVLNVFTPSTAGTFGGTALGNASMHLANGAMETKAAPGGNHQDTSANVVGGTGTGWNAEFNCASCHSPHGSYSDRLLNYNTNSIGSTDMYFETTPGAFLLADGITASPSNVPVKSGGLKLVAGTIYTVLPAITLPVDVIAFKTMSNDAVNLKTNIVPASQEATPVEVIVLMKKSGTTGTSWARDMTPWINDAATSSRATFTTFTNAAGKSPVDANKVDTLKIKLGQAYVKSLDGTVTALDTVTTANISRAVVVKFDFTTTNEGTFNGLNIKQIDISSYAKSGYGVQIAQYCAACHTDYLAKSGTATGVWSQAFRHSTTSDTYTCLKCHFGHGTDITVMLDSKDQSLAALQTGGMTLVDATAYLLDVNPSSALKRYTNMSICWKCHTSSHAGDFINNVFVQGAVNSSVYSSTEFNTSGTNLPSGWVDPNQGAGSGQAATPGSGTTTLPYGK